MRTPWHLANLLVICIISLLIDIWAVFLQWKVPLCPTKKKNTRTHLSHLNASRVFWYLLSYDPHGGGMRWVDWVNQGRRLPFTGHTVGCYRVAVKPRFLSPSSFLPWILLQKNYLTSLFIFALVWRKLIKAVVCFLLRYLMIV